MRENMLTNAHMVDIADMARTMAHPNDVATDEEVAQDLERAHFADDGALVVA